MIDFEANLLIHLSDYFYQKEFDLILDKKQFRKSSNTGFQCIIPSVSVYQEEAYIDVNLGVRHQIVESLLVQFSKHPLDYQEDTCTIMTSIAKLLHKKYFRYKVKTVQDIIQASTEIEQFMDDQGLHFLEAASQLERLEELVNFQPDQNSMYIYNNFHRCLRGIILAKMVQNLDFGYLGEVYHERLKKLRIPQEQMHNFEKLLVFLEKYSFN